MENFEGQYMTGCNPWDAIPQVRGRGEKGISPLYVLCAPAGGCLHHHTSVCSFRSSLTCTYLQWRMVILGAGF